MNEKLIQQVQQLVVAAMQGDQKATQQVQQIMDAAQKGDQQAAQIAQIIQQTIQQLKTKAAKGAKLSYMRDLNRTCAPDEEITYLKDGGCACHKKVQLDCGGAKVKLKKGGCSKAMNGIKAEMMQNGGAANDSIVNAEHKKLILKFQKDPKSLTKEELDKLHKYNRKTAQD